MRIQVIIVGSLIVLMCFFVIFFSLKNNKPNIIEDKTATIRYVAVGE